MAIYNVLVSGKAPRQKIGFFIKQCFDTGGGRVMNLYDYENKVIRRLDEPRVHFVLNCVSADCPPMPGTPLVVETLDARLDAATRAFINDPRHVTVDDAERRVTLSAIFDWFEKDFLIEAESVLDYVNRYRDEPIPSDYDVRFRSFDFTLAGERPETGR